MDFKDKVTEISKKAGKVATDTYNTVADKSGKLIEEAKSRISISDMEKEIDKMYESMGLTIYENYKKGEDVGKTFTKECKKIDKLNKEIGELNKKILFNKGLRECENCDEKISVDSIFCPSCGEKLKALRIKENKKNDKADKEEVIKQQVCPQCGKIESPDARFCPKCGYKFAK